MNVPKKKIIFHIGIQQNGLILLYLLIIREHAIITKMNLRVENQKGTVSNIIKMNLTELVSSDFFQKIFKSAIEYQLYYSYGIKKGQKVKMHASHARNADECAEKAGEWLEFYDYLEIVERPVSELRIN